MLHFDKAFIEMGLNKSVMDFIKVVLDPTDGSDAGGPLLIGAFRQTPGGQGVRREKWQGQKLAGLRPLLRAAQTRYIVDDPDDLFGLGGSGRRYPGIVPQQPPQSEWQLARPEAVEDADSHCKFMEAMREADCDVAGRFHGGGGGAAGGLRPVLGGASFLELPSCVFPLPRFSSHRPVTNEQLSIFLYLY